MHSSELNGLISSLALTQANEFIFLKDFQHTLK